jgi:hypothetical protein
MLEFLQRAGEQPNLAQGHQQFIDRHWKLYRCQGEPRVRTRGAEQNHPLDVFHSTVTNPLAINGTGTTPTGINVFGVITGSSGTTGILRVPY